MFCLLYPLALISRGNKCQLMATSLLREVTEPAVFVPEFAKQHDVFARAIAFGVLVSPRASFWLDEIIRKFFQCLYKDLPTLALTPPTVIMVAHSCFYSIVIVVSYLKMIHRDSAPHTPQVILLGPTGCGKSVQAELLASKYGLVNGKTIHSTLLSTWLSDLAVFFLKPFLEGRRFPVACSMRSVSWEVAQGTASEKPTAWKGLLSGGGVGWWYVGQWVR